MTQGVPRRTIANAGPDHPGCLTKGPRPDQLAAYPEILSIATQLGRVIAAS